MVHDAVWAQAGAVDGYLCIGCLETRLGRALGPDYFPDFPVNEHPHPWDTERLAARKAGEES